MPILPVHSHHCDEGGQELGFVVPESNAFGKDFRWTFSSFHVFNRQVLKRFIKWLLYCRSYYTEGERKSVVEETYRKNHAYQTFESVNTFISMFWIILHNISLGWIKEERKLNILLLWIINLLCFWKNYSSFFNSNMIWNIDIKILTQSKPKNLIILISTTAKIPLI